MLLRSARAIVAQNMALTAAGVAFYLVWALFPALVVVVIISALLLGTPHVMSLLSELRLDLPEAFNTVVTSQLDDIAQRSRGLSISTIVGALALALWSGTRGVRGLTVALNTVYGEVEHRSFWHRQSIAVALCLALAVFVMAAVVLIVPLTGGVIRVLRWPILMFALLVTLSTLYRYAPCRAVPKWRWVTWGAGATGTVWMASSLLLSYYAGHYTGLNPLLGSLASVMFFLLWCYLTVLAVLLGAQINAELERHTLVDTRAEESATPG